MKVLALFLLGSLIVSFSFAQEKNDLHVSVQTDLIRSDHDGYFEKLQVGAEANYFFLSKVSATGGLEYWSDGDQFSAVVGVRWYVVDYAFIRLRGLVGANDLSVGGGWTKPLGEKFKFEAMADVYADGYVAIRAGISYLIPR